MKNSIEDDFIHFKYNNLEEIKEIVSKNKLAAIKMEVQRNSTQGKVTWNREILIKKELFSF